MQPRDIPKFFTISRTYPAPDSPNLVLGPRERAMAVLKYLLGVEPEQAAGSARRNIPPHPMFDMLVNSFENQRRAALLQLGQASLWTRARAALNVLLGRSSEPMRPSLVDELQDSVDVPIRLN